MPVFAYKAHDRSGERVSGTLTADTPAVGRQSLRTLGYRLLEFAPAKFERPRVARLRGRSSKRRDQVAEFARQLSMLLRTDVPLVEALDVLIRQQRGALLPVLRDLRDRVSAGGVFGDALEQHSQWFDGVFCSAVRVGQLSGQMDESLRELAVFMRDQQSARTKLTTALAYPVILAILGTAVAIFLMSYVAPQLLSVLEASGKPLPLPTVILKGISDFLVGHWLLLTTIAGGLFVGVQALYRRPSGRRLADGLFLKLPLAGVLIRKSLIAQFAQVMSLLLNSGVAFLDALRLTRSSTRNRVLADELERMEGAVERGSDIAPTIEDSRVFPPLVVHIVNVGQRSGELTEMLSQLRDGYETEVRLAIGKFTAALEPILIVVMSVVVGFIVLATMLPVLEATRLIQ